MRPYAISLRLPDDMEAPLRRYAALRDRSINAEVVLAVKIHVREHALAWMDAADPATEVVRRQLEMLREQAYGSPELPESAR